MREPMMAEATVTAGEMGQALSAVATKLLNADIVTSAGFNVLSDEARRLKRIPEATSWRMEIDRANAVTFEDTLSHDETIIKPRITCAGISVEQVRHDRPPFTALDIALEVEDENRNPVSRWHVDWANGSGADVQQGPLVHLQYGGHRPGHRETDHPLKVPRWSHPPMDILLLCEVVAANFYPEEWESLREDPSWCAAIGTGQKLCYSAYLRKMAVGMSISSKTLLHSMWASKWIA
jgi:hypothetical protein